MDKYDNICALKTFSKLYMKIFFYSEILNTSHFPTVIQQYVHTYILHLKVICEF